MKYIRAFMRITMFIAIIGTVFWAGWVVGFVIMYLAPYAVVCVLAALATMGVHSWRTSRGS